MNFGTFNLQEFVSAFIILFAVIDAVGSTPIIISLRESGKTVKAMKATWMSTLLLVAFFYVGDVMLKLFHVDIASFAVAGSLVFPLIAGAGSFTTLLSLRAEYADVNILLALLANMGFVFFVLTMTDKVQHWMGKGGVYVVRKFFGVILIAVAVRLFTDNITTLIMDLISKVQSVP